MGREVRRVPPGWQHPLNERGSLKPLLDSCYEEAAADFLRVANSDGLQDAVDQMGCPEREDYMPTWPDSEATHLMMYETCTEGTPISPAFATPEELARWLADTGASAFGDMTATYEQWLATIRAGGSCGSAVIVDGVMMSGVEAVGALKP